MSAKISQVDIVELTKICVNYNKFKGNTIHCTRLADNIRNASGEGTSCDYCGNPIEACMCACPYCGEIDACECCLYDAATGGG
jgi:hypothetical protein